MRTDRGFPHLIADGDGGLSRGGHLGHRDGPRGRGCLVEVGNTGNCHVEGPRWDPRGIGHNVVRREAEYRLILYKSDAFRLKETLGLSYLATPVANPGREIHVPALVGSDATLAWDAGPVLELEARQTYRERIEELTSELTAAEHANDRSKTGPATEGRRRASSPP